MTDTGSQGWPEPAGTSGEQGGYTEPPTYHFPHPVTPEPGRSPARWARRLITVVAVLGLACAVGVAVNTFGSDEPGAKETTASNSAIGEAAAPSRSAAAPLAAKGDFAATVRGSVPKGSKRSSYPVRKAEDLSRVCDGWYYPKAPKYTGLAPHSIVMSSQNDKALDSWLVLTIYDLPYDTADAVKNAWAPKNPAKVQLMACAEAVSIGPKVATCHVDKPKPKKVPMKVSNFRVTLYEVATRRKLAQVRMKGEDETCGPFLILVGADGATYTDLDDRQLIEALRRYVEE
ncbi:hypothetical protein [Actinoplanes sp. NPDC026623]|uniref:hypothetical protein n=1 Tax=Actinoplanes sp. NPDC026623 TaxID=3155610 RepID=UPI0033D1C23E